MRTIFVSVLVALVLGAAPLLAQKTLTPEQVKALEAAGFTKEEIAEMVLGRSAPTTTGKAVGGDTVTIPRRTPVDIKVGEQLDSGKTPVGPFKCAVDRDVKVNNVVVIASGAPAVCRVVAIEKGTATIKRASIKIAADSVTAANGSTVFLDYNEVHGGGGMGFGKIRPGLTIKAGTILPAVVDEKVEVKLPSATKAEVK